MEKIDIISWVLGSGLSLMFGLMLVMWHNLNHQMDKLDEKVTDIDRCLCRLEGAFSLKDCCMIKDERKLGKAE